MEIIKTVYHQASWEYSTCFVENMFKDHSALAELINDRKTLVVTTPTVNELYGYPLRQFLNNNDIDAEVLVLSVKEQDKTMATVERICAEAQKFGLTRKSLMIGFGGGVCTDLVSVSASLFRRGISFVRIPTTLIGQVDAGIGIKGSLNFNDRKSYLGCFLPPEAVLIDKNFLKTLPAHHLRNGFAEIIKMALIGNVTLFQLVEEHASSLINTGFTHLQRQGKMILEFSIRDMLAELETNFYETKVEPRYADFGHTFSPSLESKTKFVLSHGEAVSIDMALSAAISHIIGWLSKENFDRIIRMLQHISLPISSSFLTVDLCLKAINDAEQNRGGIHLVVPTNVGKADFINDYSLLSPQIIENAIALLNVAHKNYEDSTPVGYAHAANF